MSLDPLGARAALSCLVPARGWCAGERAGVPSLLARLVRDRRGSIMVKFALVLPVMFALVGGTIDYGMLVRQKARLQDAADAAAKGAALEFTLIDTSKSDVDAITRATVYAMISADADTAAAPVTVTGRAETTPLRVTVDAVQEFKGPFGVLSGSASRISVRAVAEVVGKPNICVLGLATDVDGAIELWTKARLTAQNCAVYSNSTSPLGILSKSNAQLSASLICSAGGKDGGKGNFTPDPITDCPIFDDPLASRAAPIYSGCNFTNKQVVGGQTTLDPGVYCGGLVVRHGAVVTFAPGEYVIKDGPFIVADTASISGTGVGFYLTGSNARFQFGIDTTISLVAPSNGVMAGLLFHESRDQPTISSHAILSDNARVLLGTIYLPRGDLKIDAKKPVADQSAYTAIVAHTLKLYSGPNLVLNTNYDQTSVPVPDGIKGVGQPVALVQ